MAKIPIGKKGYRKKPRLKWQKGAYERHVEYKFILPYEFLLICKLLDVEPQNVLSDFMNAVSCGSVNGKGKEGAVTKAVEYFLECGYGEKFYSEQSRREMFRELNSLGILWPAGAKMKFIEMHAKWHTTYLNHWFKKWYRIIRRKD